MNDARNMDNNRTSELFINQSVPSLNKFEVDPQDDILILFDEENGDAAGTDKEVDILSNILYKGKNCKAWYRVLIEEEKYHNWITSWYIEPPNKHLDFPRGTSDDKLDQYVAQSQYTRYCPYIPISYKGKRF